MTFHGIPGGLVKSLKWGLITLALIYGLLLAINAKDEAPSPESRSLLVLPQTNADTTNGYLAFVGSTRAPANEDIFNYGARWVDTYNAATDSAAIEKANAWSAKASAPTFQGDVKLLCNPSKTSCLPQAKKDAGLWRKLAADNGILLARQHRLTEFSHFEESYFPPSVESPSPAYGNTSRLLALDMIALDAAEGRLEPALAALEACIAFDRRALLGSRSMIMGMVARSWLGQDYALLAEIVATGSTALMAQKVRLDRMTEPIEINQIRAIAGRMFEGESRYLASKLHEAINKPEVITGSLIETSFILLGRPFFKQQATQNLVARNHVALQARVLDFSPESYDAWIAQAQQHDKQIEADAVYSWRILYNPSGKIGMSIGSMGEYGYGSYILKLSDLIGITRLARLQVEAVTSGASADIPARIAANKALYDPYTGKPMGWDADKRQLYFDARADFPQGTSKHIHAGI